MLLTLETVYMAIPTLNELSNLKLPIKSSFKIGCLLDDLNVYTRNIEKERNKLLKELAEKKEDGTLQLLPTDKNHQVFIDRFNEFLKTEVDIDLEFPIDLNEIENEKIEPRHMRAIRLCVNKSTLSEKV